MPGLQGTLAADGVGLLAAVMQHFSDLPTPPKVIVTTHFNEVFDEAYLPR